MSSNSWNDFQEEHGGEGLSQTDMSEMYHEEQDTTETSDEVSAAEQTNDISADLSNGDSELDQTVVNGYDATSESNNEAIDQTEETSGSGNSWNEFQHEHAGEGLSHGDMSEMYHAEQDTAETSHEEFATEETNDNSELNPTATNDSDSDSGTKNDIEEEAENETSDQNEENSSSDNPWNAFQHEHAGEGLIHTDMSEMYHAEKDAAETGDEAPPTQQTDDTNTKPSSDSNELGQTTATESNVDSESNNDLQIPSEKQSPNQDEKDSTSSNAWNDFQHKNAGQGLNHEEMTEKYHAEQDIAKSSNSSENLESDNEKSVPTAVNTSNVDSQSNYSTSDNSWNDFQHKNAGQGLSQEEMVEKYHAQPSAANSSNSSENPANDNEKSIPMAVIRSNVDSQSNNSASSKSWNDFQHKSSGQGLSHEEMSKKYHAEYNAATSSYSSENLENDNNESAPTGNADSQSNNSTSGNSGNQSQHKHKASNYIQQSEESVENQSKVSEQDIISHPQQNKRTQKQPPSIQWNLFQRLHRGEHSTIQEVSTAYKQFKEDAKTFKWGNDFQLSLTPNGELQDPDSPAGQQAIKTGLFNKENRLRRCDELPYTIFQSKMFDMNMIDRSKISSMYWNQSGTSKLRTENLRQSSYRNHAAAGTSRRDADHILELQVVLPILQQQYLSDEDYHAVRCFLNGKQNIESRGIKINRDTKAIANRGIARNNINLTKGTFEQEQIQAEQAQHLADLCHENNYSGAESIFRYTADRCNALHSIHHQLMKFREKGSDPDADEQRKCNLKESIHQYESKYGSLRFHGRNLTNYRQRILQEVSGI